MCVELGVCDRVFSRAVGPVVAWPAVESWARWTLGLGHMSGLRASGVIPRGQCRGVAKAQGERQRKEVFRPASSRHAWHRV
jgi:hypothetical protein